MKYLLLTLLTLMLGAEGTYYQDNWEEFECYAESGESCEEMDYEKNEADQESDEEQEDE